MSQHLETCVSCGTRYDDEVYICPIHPRRLFFILKNKPAKSQLHHQGTHIKTLAHAVDYNVLANTPVYAARDGIVVEAVAHFTEGAEDEGLRFKANYICIRHDNGKRYSRYYHLKAARVAVGQHVKAGEVIGHSGNTGFTMGPHLHFDVVDILGTDVARLIITDNGVGRIIPCLPMTFSKVPFPEQAITWPLYCVEPSDLSADPQLPFEEKGLALIALRGGEATFLEKTKRAENVGASCLIIVDNDSSMGDAMPVVVGDSSAAVNVWVVYVSFANYEWAQALATRQRHEAAHLLPHSCSVSLSVSPFYHPRPEQVGEEAQPFCKPITLPVKIKE